MNRIKLTTSKFAACIVFILALVSSPTFAQVIAVDGVNISASQLAKFPFWLDAGQTLAAGASVNSVSVLEYSVVPGGADNELRFVGAKKITTVQAVPAGKTWKVEAALLDASVNNNLNGWADDGTTVRLTTISDNVGIGTSSPSQKLDVTGNLALSGKEALSGGDPWLRLNQSAQFSSGTYTPGFFRVDGGIASGIVSSLGAGTVNASDVINSGIGYRIGNAAASGTYLRGNGTSFVQSSIQVADVPTLNQNTTGNAATATNVAFSGVTSIPVRTSWVGVHRGFVAEQLSWKNYGNSHTIFDASAGTSPDGSAVDKTNSQSAWTANYPTLMGWNGSNTYGVRVDMARYAESAGTASSVPIGNVTGSIPLSRVTVDAGGGYMHLGAWTGASWNVGNSVLVQGAAYWWGLSPSDRKLKQNISAVAPAELKSLSNDLLNAPLYRYQYIEDPMGKGLNHLGMMADEAPTQMQINGTASINIIEGFMMSVAAIKVLKQEKDELLQRIEKLEQQVQRLSKN